MDSTRSDCEFRTGISLMCRKEWEERLAAVAAVLVVMMMMMVMMMDDDLYIIFARNILLQTSESQQIC